MMQNKWAIGLCGALLLSTGCKMKQNLDEMHSSTLGMERTTLSMEATTCTMYRSLRQGNAKLSRDKDFEDIQDAKNIAARLTEASEYMQGFEFQVWSPLCKNEIPRELVVEQGMRELLNKAQIFMHNRAKPWATKTGKDAQTLQAMAATLHYTNALQPVLLGDDPDYDQTVLSPYSLLIEGLEQDASLGANAPSWVQVVGKYQKDAIFLLQVRLNFLMAYAYAIADSNSFGDTPGVFKKIWTIGKTKYLDMDWEPKLKNRTETEFRERVVVSMRYAVQTYDDLKALGIRPIVDRDIRGIWENFKLSDSDMSAETLSEFARLAELISKF